MAAKLNDTKIVRLLLLHGAFPTPLDLDGKRPIDYVDKKSSIFKLLTAFTGERSSDVVKCFFIRYRLIFTTIRVDFVVILVMSKEFDYF